MHYNLRYEKDPTWRAFHADSEVATATGLKFVPKYFWYVDGIPYAISPGLNSLVEAKQWFEIHHPRVNLESERRQQSKERRFKAISALTFATRFDRRKPSGRRWTDQIAQYAH